MYGEEARIIHTLIEDLVLEWWPSLLSELGYAYFNLGEGGGGRLAFFLGRMRAELRKIILHTDRRCGARMVV